MTAPASMQYTRSEIAMISGRSCSTTISVASSSVLHPLDQRPERLGLALGDAGGRLVEADHPGRDREHRGELDDAARPGRQLGDEPVGVAAEPEEVDELGGLGPLRPLGRVAPGRQASEPQNDVRAARLERELRPSRARSARGTAWRPGTCARARPRRAGARAGARCRVPEQLDPPVGSARSRRSRSAASTCRRRSCRSAR